ncbi:MAG: DinB family protein [Candidatus Rokuibacteriota bacterium]
MGREVAGRAAAPGRRFGYFDRLNRTQQAIYLKSDAITTVALPDAERLRPAVVRLADALRQEDRPATNVAAQALASGLAGDLRVPPVRVQVLAARPHARWGELHGLYEVSRRRGAVPLITLWMRTARQKRVVAFRTFLRTLLHEVGHHLDYTLLGLGDSFHTQGFYARESHLFHQLVTDGGIGMATLDEQLARMERTGDDLAAAIANVHEARLGRRPDDQSWAAVEVLCHLRDIEESFIARIAAIMAMDEPRFLPVEPDRWAVERQYLRNDAGEALGAFRKRRAEALAFLRGLKADHWERGGLHATRGRMTVRDFVGLMAWHDDNHLDQLRRALDGKP